MNLASGTKLGPYEIASLLGAGGMGEVYRARDSRLKRDVAIKVLPQALSADADRLRRFEQEALATAALNHPNILAVFDIGTYESSPYVVSEMLEGETLRDRLRGGSIATRKALDYALQIAHGLAAAHEKGIVHRDLKPENLFITRDGRIKILDFGVAKLQSLLENDQPADAMTTVTKSGAVVGTVAYMSPEQLRGKPVDHRSDVFSVGAILYEMLTGRRAFRGETEVDTMTAVLREEPPEMDVSQGRVPSSLHQIIRHCLEKEPENRFQSGKDLAFALEALSGSSTSKANLYWSPRPRRLRALLGMAGAALLAAALFLLGTQ